MSAQLPDDIWPSQTGAGTSFQVLAALMISEDGVLCARSALTATFGPHVEVVSRKRVAMLAVSSSRIDSCRSIAPADVDALSDSFEVYRVDAGLITAEVVEHQTVRHRTSEELVCGAVGEHVSVVAADADPSVSSALEVASGSPDPTPVFVHFDLGHEANRHRRALTHCEILAHG